MESLWEKNDSESYKEVKQKMVKIIGRQFYGEGNYYRIFESFCG